MSLIFSSVRDWSLQAAVDAGARGEREGRARDWPARARKGQALFQSGQVSPEIDVIGVAAYHESRNRLHPRRLGLGDAILGLAEMHDLDVVFPGVEAVGELPLGVGANWAAGVVENRFL